MFKDRDDALLEMEQALLEEEALGEALEALDEEEFEDYGDFDEEYEDIAIYNSDLSDEDLEDYSVEVAESAPEGSILGLALLALTLLTGILALAVHWVFRLMGA